MTGWFIKIKLSESFLDYQLLPVLPGQHLGGGELKPAVDRQCLGQDVPLHNCEGLPTSQQLSLAYPTSLHSFFFVLLLKQNRV